jgi:hypothetical protein
MAKNFYIIIEGEVDVLVENPRRINHESVNDIYYISKDLHGKKHIRIQERIHRF